jgi:hypothetical protein
VWCFASFIVYLSTHVCVNDRRDSATQWSKEKGQKDKLRSTKHTHKTKDRVTGTPLKTDVSSGSKL